jgi:hypothetical protein
MRKLQMLTYVSLITMIVMIGCKRESPNENSKNKETSSLNTAKPTNVIYKATEAERTAAKEAWLKKAKESRKDGLARGGCGEHLSEFIFLNQITGCSSSSWTIVYDIFSYDLVGSGYDPIPVSASFTDMYFGFPISATLLSYNASLVDPDCKEWQWDGYCEMVRYYQYELTNVPAPSSAWPADIGNYSLDLLSGFSSNCTPLTVSGDLKGGFTAAEYASMPARVYVNPVSGGNVFIGTDCSLLCVPPNVICPSGGTFQYWPIANPGNVTTISIPVSGTIEGPLASDTYGYSAVLTYNIGGTITTLPSTGIFVIP